MKIVIQTLLSHRIVNELFFIESPITSYPQPIKSSKLRNTEPRTLVVTHDPKIGQNRTGIWMTKATQFYPTASSFIRGTNMVTSQPVCCCCIM